MAHVDVHLVLLVRIHGGRVWISDHSGRGILVGGTGREDEKQWRLGLRENSGRGEYVVAEKKKKS